MATINLLPRSITLKGKDKLLLESIQKLIFLGFLIFIVATLIIIGYLIFVSVRIRASVNREESLKSQITTLSQTEQSFFLIKDRLSKVKLVLAKESTNAQIETLSNFLNSLATPAGIIEIQLAGTKLNLTATFPSSASFGSFYKSLVVSDVYDPILLKSLSFNPSVGYIATFEINRK